MEFLDKGLQCKKNKNSYFFKVCFLFYRWEFTDNGKQIKQTVNSLATLAIGDDVFNNVRFTGSLFVEDTSDNDVVGLVLNYQDNKNFYVVTAAKQDSGQVGDFSRFISVLTQLLQGTWSLRRVNSITGHPSNELQVIRKSKLLIIIYNLLLQDAIFNFGADRLVDIANQTKLLYKHPSAGWKVN